MIAFALVNLICVVFVYISLPSCKGLMCLLFNVRYEIKNYYYHYYYTLTPVFTLFKKISIV